jgi:hypothetical protein
VTQPLDLTATDPLDGEMARAASMPAPAVRHRLQRAALGLAATRVPVVLTLAAGAALGPHGIALLTAPILDALQPLIPVALGALGVLLGLGIDIRSWREARLLAAGSVQSAVTITAIAAACAVTLRSSAIAELPFLLFVVLVAACGGPSSSRPAAASQSAAGERAIRIVDLNDLLPVILAGTALTLGAGALAPREAGVVLLKAAGAGAAFALIGWLLTDDADSDGERRVFILAVVLLIAGAAEYLRVPSLLVGLVAGLVWGWTDRGERLAGNVRALQHPIAVTLLVMAGARLVISDDVVALAAAWVLARAAGKFVGGRLGSALFDRETGMLVARGSIAPGLVGIALALTVDRFFPGRAASTLLLSAVVAGSMLSDVLSLSIEPEEPR